MTLKDLNLSEHSRDQITLFQKKPKQVLMIVGRAGSGKTTTAERLIAQLLGIKTEGLDKSPNLRRLTVDEGKQDISIDSVRELIRFLNKKIVYDNGQDIKQAVLVEEAGKLSTEAQNALLKTIEEPGPNRIFVLCCPSASSVLPTIASRAQIVQLTPVSLEKTKNYYKGRYKVSDIESAWLLSEGAAGLINAILCSNDEHSLKKAVNEAKYILAESRYQKLLTLDRISSSKSELELIHQALLRIYAALQRQAIAKKKQNDKFSSRRKLLDESYSQLNKNASSRLLGLKLALNL